MARTAAGPRRAFATAVTATIAASGGPERVASPTTTPIRAYSTTPMALPTEQVTAGSHHDERGMVPDTRPAA